MSDTAELALFGSGWSERWPSCRPIAHELRSSARDTWVRFHSLPESKRHPESDAEYETVFARHYATLEDLSELTQTSPADLRVVTVAWSESSQAAPRDAALVSAFPGGNYWQSLVYDLDDVEDPVWVHLYVGATSLWADELRKLLVLVADDVTREVIICPPAVDWLYCPYDGGGDVIAPDAAARDLMRARHAEWLPANALGL